MSGMRTLVAAVLLLAAGTARAGIVFTPHVSEYARLPAGQYSEFTLIGTQIESIYDRNGDEIELGVPFVPPGDSTDAFLALAKFLWIGNLFRDSDWGFLADRPQFCRLIGTVGYQQNTGAIAARARLFNQRPGANGLGDLFGLCGIYGLEHRWGPIKGNGLFATTVKIPVGRYDTQAALNTGTNYWSVIPQLAFHAEAWGRVYIDGTLAWQFNGDNDRPSFGGLTPTGIADVRNAEINIAWKFSEHWFADVGYSFRESVGPNQYDKVTINFEDQPLSPQSACDNTNNGTNMLTMGFGPVVSQELCDSPALDQFFLRPRPGPYRDLGVEGRLLTAGISYVYRASTVVQARIAQPVGGRGSQIDVLFDVCPDADCTTTTGAPLTSRLFGVQEAAAVSASPYLELRLVYLPWAP
ncbi:MAG TPA: transporter [Nevskiaceae bacterium]|nr:transporter [Nevskiaceae bacterium]